MTFASKHLVAAAISTAVLGMAVGALAQDRPAAPAGAGAQRPFMQQMQQRMQERQAEHAKALHDVLAIRPDQEAAFQAFNSALHPQRDHAGDRRRDRGPGAQPGGARAEAISTPQKLDRMVARMHERDQRMEARVTAIKTFYAALSPQQQRTFDELPMLRGGMGGHGRHGRGMGAPRA